MYIYTYIHTTCTHTHIFTHTYIHTQDVWVALAEKIERVGKGLLQQFIPDLIPENMEFDQQKSVVSEVTHVNA